MTARDLHLDAGLNELGADALLVLASSSSDSDLAPFVGPVHLHRSFLIKAPGEPAVLGYLVDMERQEAAATGLELLAPSADELAELRRSGVTENEIWSILVTGGIERARLESGRIAVAGHPPAGVASAVGKRLSERGLELVDGHGLLRRLRKAKTGYEIDEVRRAAAGTRAAFRRVADLLAGSDDVAAGGSLERDGTPLTAGVLRAAIATELAGHGLEQPEGNIVACGGHAGVPHTRGDDDRALRSGEPVVIDLFPRGRLFADCTRTFCVGRPSDAFRSAHALCRRALEIATEGARPGIEARELHERVCDLFEGEGYATPRSDAGVRTGYVHGLGHGVGLELHELPSFRKARHGDGTLEEGDVFTLEPGLYAPDDGWGVRLEDLLVMTSSGPENLTALPYGFDPVEWRDA